jgi:DNA polymerase
VVVCLGATASQALLGKGFHVTSHRGEVFSGPHGIPTVATVHPSSILRIRDHEQRSVELAQFTDDLQAALRRG